MYLLGDQTKVRSPGRLANQMPNVNNRLSVSDGVKPIVNVPLSGSPEKRSKFIIILTEQIGKKVEN